MQFTFIGGQIAVLVTDFMQSAFWNATMIVILAFMLWKFDWSMITDVLSRAPTGKSMLNPFDTGQTEGFNFWYFMIMGYFMTIYNCGGLSWQGGTAYHCAAKSASEFKMSRILGIYRVMASSLMVMILAVCAYVIMNHEHFADLAAKVNGVIGQVSTADAVSTETLQKQMLVPVILRNLFPVGLMGLFCAAMFAAFVSTHDTYLHSWGSIFIQDVILPFRKKPFTAKQHLWLLRVSILFVAVFIYCFGLLFKQNEYIYMFWAITGAIYVSGAGAVILGGLYWKRGSALGAWAAMIWGSTTSLGTLVLRQIWPKLTGGNELPINSAYISFFITVVAIVLYVVLSLLQSRKPFNLERMLHRGKYLLKGEQADIAAGARGFAVFGFDRRLPPKDKMIFLFAGLYVLVWTIVFVVGTIWHLTVGISDVDWAIFWQAYTWLGYGTLIVVSVWFLTGGVIDLKQLFTDLKEVKRNELDDGMVVAGRSLGEEFAVEETQAIEESDRTSPGPAR